MAIKYLIEAHYYNEPSFLLEYSKEEIEWVRSGENLPQSIVEAAKDPLSQIDLEALEEAKEEGIKLSPSDRVRITSEYAYLGDYRSMPSLKDYVWSEFTDMLLI